MKIFDCFCFFNELELLELRFMELYDTVDYFVIAEGNKTHTGKPKDFIFEKNKDLFQKYLDKVIYIKVEDFPDFDPHQILLLEHHQRNALRRGYMPIAKPGDKILISDLDEIPKADTIKNHLNTNEPLFFQQPLYYYFVNNQVVKSCGGTVMANFGHFGSPQRHRVFAKRRYNYDPQKHPEVIPDSGWHYSYLFGSDTQKIRQKIESMAESDNLLTQAGNETEILNKINTQKDIFNRETWRVQQSIVDISTSQPKSMPTFLKKYPQLFFKKTPINNRSDLANYFNSLGFKTGAEIGVLAGDYSALLCQKIPNLKLYCVDSWGFGENRKRNYHLKKYEQAKVKLAPYDTTIIYKLSMEAVKDFKDNSLDFVYIDANHEPQFVTEDIREWTKKVKIGGIVAGHDYSDRLAKVVDQYVNSNNYDLHLTTEPNEKISWWFVKNKPTIKLSIIIAFYNSHEAVKRQVKHFAQMNLPDDIEFIFVDDGSNPPHDISNYDLKNLKLIHTNDKRPWTQGLARNTGATSARGEYLMMTDIDHILSYESIIASHQFNGDKLIFPRFLAALLENGELTQNPELLSQYGLDLERLKTKRGLYASYHGNTFTMKKSTFMYLGMYDTRNCTFGHHAASRQGEDSVLNRKWNHFAKSNNIEIAVGPAIYIFPVGRYHKDHNLNPLGLFHNLSYDLVQQPNKP